MLSERLFALLSTFLYERGFLSRGSNGVLSQTCETVGLSTYKCIEDAQLDISIQVACLVGVICICRLYAIHITRTAPASRTLTIRADKYIFINFCLAVGALCITSLTVFLSYKALSNSLVASYPRSRYFEDARVAIMLASLFWPVYLQLAAWHIKAGRRNLFIVLTIESILLAYVTSYRASLLLCLILSCLLACGSIKSRSNYNNMADVFGRFCLIPSRYKVASLLLVVSLLIFSVTFSSNSKLMLQADGIIRRSVNGSLYMTLAPEYILAYDAVCDSKPILTRAGSPLGELECPRLSNIRVSQGIYKLAYPGSKVNSGSVTLGIWGELKTVFNKNLTATALVFILSLLIPCWISLTSKFQHWQVIAAIFIMRMNQGGVQDVGFGTIVGLTLLVVLFRTCFSSQRMNHNIWK